MDQHSKNSGSHHHILKDSDALKIGGILLGLTVLTVALSYVHLGALNFVVGMLVATVKASLVVAVFMNMKHERKTNLVIFLTAFVFLAIFVSLTATDLFFRGDIYVTKDKIFKDIAGGGTAKFTKPWIPTEPLKEHGKTLFAQQCASCHGANGQGDGAAAAALNPKPRNFTQEAGWKNGRKPAQIFKTLREGIAGGGMASFSTLAAEDRWALSHYVASLGPNVLKDSEADWVAQGVDPSKDTMGTAASKQIAIGDAMKILSSEHQNSKNVKDGFETNALEHYSNRLNEDSFSKK